ncbi:MAG: hypothetical protein AAGC57_17325 [Pseudomonadota bacterium]
MKSASNFECTKQWWKKEQPGGLKKSAQPFERAIEEVVKCRAAFTPGDAGSAKTLAKALDLLEKTGKDVSTEAKDLEKKTKDKKEKTDLQNTVQVMDKPLTKLLQEYRGELDEAPEPEDDDEDVDEEVSANALTDPDQHSAYIRKIAPKLKRKVFSFALGLPSNDPADMRFSFHPKKGGRGLGGGLKKAIGAKKFTFGKAGTDELETSVTGGEGSGGRTLVLYLEGRNIPSLAKRVKLMLRSLKISAFGKVKIVKDGKELESADDSTDLSVEAVDLDAPDDEDLAAPETASAPETDGRADALKRRLAAVNKGLATMPEETAAKLKEMAKKALGAIGANQLDGAEKIIQALEQRVGGQTASTGDEKAEQVRKALAGLAKRIKGLEDQTLAATLGGQAQEILSMLRAGQTGDALQALAALSEALKTAESGVTAPAPEPEEDDGGDPMVAWRNAKELTDGDLGNLQAALSGFPDPNLQRIAEFGLNGVADENGKGRQVAMMRAIMDYNGAGPDTREAAAGKLRQEVSDYRTFIEGDPLIKLCEKNPFGVKVDIRGPMIKALTRIETLVAG